MKIRHTITKILLPFIRLISKLGKPEPRLTYTDLDYIKKIIKPGDVLLSREDYRLSNVFIKGFYGHAAIYVGDGFVLEAVPPRVRKISLEEFVLSADSICVLRPMFELNFCDHSEEYVGHIYDYEFLQDNEGWYCSELVYDYLKKCAPDLKFKPAISWGVETVTPEDFYLAHNFFLPIFEIR